MQVLSGISSGFNDIFSRGMILKNIPAIIPAIKEKTLVVLTENISSMELMLPLDGERNLEDLAIKPAGSQTNYLHRCAEVLAISCGR